MFSIKELIVTHFDAVLAGSFAIVGAFLGAIIGAVSAYWTAKKSHEWNRERDKDSSLSELKLKIYSELLYLLDEPPRPNDEEKVSKTLGVLNQCSLLASKQLFSIIDDIWNEYADMRSAQIEKNINDFQEHGIKALKSQKGIEDAMRTELGIALLE